MEKHPKFRKDLTASEYIESGGKKSIILKEPVTERYFRISQYEYDLLISLDGSRSMEQAIEYLKGRGCYYTKEDAHMIMYRAAQYGLLLGTAVATAKYIKSMKEQIKKAGKAKLLSSSFFYSIPLWNPDKFLERTVWIFRLVANKWLLLPFVTAAIGAVLLVLFGFSRIQREYLYFFNAQNLFFLWLTISLTKLIHEFSHAYCAKNFNLHVPQMGVSFLLFIPCLFCNTTDAWQLADRKQRMAISAAGIMAESVIAVLAVYLWYFSKPGILNSLAFYSMTVSFVSTVIFNGNPLIKFDGYFILMDYLRIPNLNQKSVDHVKYLFMNRVLGINQYQSAAQSPRELLIFTLYGFATMVYRVFLYSGMVAGVYYRFDKFIGILLAIPAFCLFVVRPIVKGLQTIYSRRSQLSLRKKGALVFVSLALLLTAILVAPCRLHSTYACRVTSQKIQKITAPLDAPIKEVLIRQGSSVAEGDLLLTLDTSLLHASLDQMRIDRDIVEQEMNLLLLDESQRAQAEMKKVELLKIEDSIKRQSHKLDIAAKGIRAPFEAVITSLEPRAQTGFRPGEGAIIGEMESVAEEEVQALIPEEDLAKVRKGQMVKVSFPIGQGKVFSRPVEHLRRYSERNLADSPFSSRFGGMVATEQKEHEQDAPLNAYYTCSVTLNGQDVPLGMTGKLIVSARPTSLLMRFVEHLAQTFNRETLL